MDAQQHIRQWYTRIIMVKSYIVVDVAGKVSDSKCVCLVRKWLEVVPVLAVMVVQFLQQRQIRSLGKTL